MIQPNENFIYLAESEYNRYRVFAYYSQLYLNQRKRFVIDEFNKIIKIDFYDIIF